MNLSEILHTFGTTHRLTVTQKSDTEFILASPVPGRRNQLVLTELITNELYNRLLVRISSVVCAASAGLNLIMLLEQSSYFNYCRFAIRNKQIMVESVFRADALTSDLIGEIIMEVANLADQYELKLTGKDLH